MTERMMTGLVAEKQAREASHAKDTAALKAAVAIHPALAAQAATEAKARNEKGQFVPEQKPEPKPEVKPVTPDPKPDQAAKVDQAKNFEALRAEVAAAKARAEALAAEVAALKAKPVEQKPVTDPMKEAMDKALEKVPAEHKDYFQKHILPSVQEVIRPVAAEAAALRDQMQQARAEQERLAALAVRADRWAQENGLTSEQAITVIEEAHKRGLKPLMDANPEVAFNTTRDLLGLSKTTTPTPEQEKALAEAKAKAEAKEKEEERARLAAGGVDSSASGTTPTEDDTTDYGALIANARQRGNHREVQRLEKIRLLRASGVDMDWLHGRKVILGAE